MKINLTVKILRVDSLSPSDLRALPRDLQDTLSKMPQSEGLKKSILFVESFAPKLIDNKAVKSYFPMLVERTFHEALALLSHCDNLTMSRGPLSVYWNKGLLTFIDQDGEVWCPSPADLLSNQEEWYVNSKTESNQKKAEFPDIC